MTIKAQCPACAGQGEDHEGDHTMTQPEQSNCDHHESLYGRCTACGMTWKQQAEQGECPRCGWVRRPPIDDPLDTEQSDIQIDPSSSKHLDQRQSNSSAGPAKPRDEAAIRHKIYAAVTEADDLLRDLARWRTLPNGAHIQIRRVRGLLAECRLDED